MNKSNVFEIPAGLSGIMSYSHVKLGEYHVELTDEAVAKGIRISVFVDEATDDHLSFHVEEEGLSEDFIEQLNKSPLCQLELLQYSDALGKRLVYYHNRKD